MVEILLAAVLAAGAASPASDEHLTIRAKAPHPGKERWPVKLMPATGDAQFLDLVWLLHLPVPAEVRHSDARYQGNRLPPEVWTARGLVEGSRVVTSGYLRLVALEDDGDLHCQISIDTTTPAVAIVEVPDPRFVPDLIVMPGLLTAARAFLTGLLPKKVASSSGTVLKAPPKVCVMGALFYDDGHVGLDGAVEPRGKKGMAAPSLWEIHPVEAVWIDTGNGCASK